MKDLTGYVTVRKFRGYALPVPVQNKLLRMYASENQMIYVLPQCELVTKNNFMMLFDTLNNMKENKDLGMCSIHMLPKNFKKFKSALKIIMKKNITLHFIFEEKKINAHNLEDYYIDNNLENILDIKSKNEFLEFI